MTMPSQLSLLDSLDLPPLTHVATRAGQTIEERFSAFHVANPHVYRALRSLALDLRRRGCQRYGMKGLFELLRWQSAISAKGPAEPYKLNNIYTAHYARLLIVSEPALAGFFETREHANGELQ